MKYIFLCVMCHDENPEMFWCTDTDRMEWLFNLNIYKLTGFVSKA